MIGVDNSDKVNYVRAELSWGFRGSGSHIRFNVKALSKACIHKENELKTRPMELALYIYKRGGNYQNVQGGPCRCIGM